MKVSPSGLAFRERLFGHGHPYAEPPATVAQIAAITADQLSWWRHRHFEPALPSFRTK